MHKNLETLCEAIIEQATCLQTNAAAIKNIEELKEYAAHSEGIAAGLMLAVKWTSMVLKSKQTTQVSYEHAIKSKCPTCKLLGTEECITQNSGVFDPVGCKITSSDA